MLEDIKILEEDFANNEYFGTNVWTEEKYRVLSGNNCVLLSAPHSVNQIRSDDVRDAEKYTGAITRYLSQKTSSYAIFEVFTHADPNSDINHNYKDAVVNLIENFDIKILLDIHSSTFSDDTDIDIVTNNRETLCGMDSLIDKLKTLAIKHDVKIDEHNVPNKDKENEIIGATSLLCGIPSIRLVINNKRIDIDDENNIILRICMLLEDFISYVNYYD